MCEFHQGVGQAYVLRQRKNDCCGYYCLFNAVLVLSAICAEGDKAKEACTNMLDRRLFWSFFCKLKKMLHEKVEVREGYPWTHSIVSSGVLERTFITYILESQPLFRMVQEHSGVGITNFPDLSSQYLKHNTVDEGTLMEMEKVFSKILESQTYAHVFILGQMVHWVTVVVNKVDGFVETILLDSRNMYVLGASEEEIKQLVDNRCTRRGYVVPAWKLDLWYQSCIDINWSVMLINNCCTGKANVKDVLIDHFIDGFLSLFFSIVRGHQFKQDGNERKEETMSTEVGKEEELENEKLQKNQVKADEESVEKREIDCEDENKEWKDAQVQEFERWLIEYYPPAVIQSSLVRRIEQHGSQNLSNITWNRLFEWICFVNVIVTRMRNLGSPGSCSESFCDVLDWLRAEFPHQKQ
eukprot:TRINITY_DN14485_c0_g1_i3.p1 TRINITY_DN14485_c0_g1~~TRINITY_DN14485_c0_g1_i3.p1  ORF type:complete len:411 (-),score=88.68 TRINITY_DN14485_c0_g1_i3:93-1325(-)